MKKLVHSLILASLLSTSGLRAQDPADKSSPPLSSPEMSLPSAENAPVEKKTQPSHFLPEAGLRLPLAEIIAPAEETQETQVEPETPIAAPVTTPDTSLPSAEFKPPEFRKKATQSEWHNWIVAAGLAVSVTAGILLVSMDRGAPDRNF